MRTLADIVWRLFWVFGVLVLLAATGPCNATSDGVSARPVEDCWMFNRMPKTGSTTVVLILRTFALENTVDFANCGYQEWEDDRRLLHLRDSNLTIVSGEYTESLRAMGAYDSCKWFTMMRHPISRMVSMFLYCKYQDRNDQNCGKGAFDFDAEDADLHSFAEFYSNESLRQFIMAFFTPHEIRASGVIQGIDRRFPGWYKVGLYIKKKMFKNVVGGPGANSSLVLHDAAFETFLRPAMDLIETYAAVAIFEDFENSLVLFNRALNIPGMDWVEAFEAQGKKNVNIHVSTNEKTEMLSAAWTDSALRAILWLDILLYDHAVAIYKKQLAKYGLS